MGIKFRLLRADEIEVRTQQTKENGTSVLLYKTARTDANLLDETVGAENWQNDFKSIDGKMFGYISIKYDGEWVTKSDSGTEGNIEAEKSLASDAFKRAGFKWGIGRELYTAPFIWLSSDVIKIEMSKTGKPITKETFSVSKIAYNDNREISMLEIVNNKGKTVFTFNSKTPIVMQPDVSHKISDVCQREITEASNMKELSAVFHKYENIEPLQDLKDSCNAKRELLQLMQ